MQTTHPAQLSFVRGELSPLTLGEPPRGGGGAKRVENLIIQPQGPLTRRCGTHVERTNVPASDHLIIFKDGVLNFPRGGGGPVTEVVVQVGAWTFFDQGFVLGGQNGGHRSYSDPSQVSASPWAFIPGTTGIGLRLDWENDANCGGVNPYTQSAGAQLVLYATVTSQLKITWQGMGERQDPEFERMDLWFARCQENGTLITPESLVGSASSPGGGLGCAHDAPGGPVGPVVSHPTGPQFLTMTGGNFYRIRIAATTGDSLYHTGAWYQFALDF